jgi:hypothetical protein
MRRVYKYSLQLPQTFLPQHKNILTHLLNNNAQQTPHKWYSSKVTIIGTTNNITNTTDITGLNYQHQYLNEEEQKELLDELYTLNNHVWKVKSREEQPIGGVKYDQFLVKSSDLFGRTVIHILYPYSCSPLSLSLSAPPLSLPALTRRIFLSLLP